jgi:Uma2 family endonuclease
MTLSTISNIIYPESDGEPLADNTKQFRLIVTIQGGLDFLFSEQENVFVAGDLFWYPVEGEPSIRQAPDVMVVFGRPKGERRSYQQWEEDNIPPQVVFEIASKSNTIKELEVTKLEFYERHGVEEYYLYDPDRITLKGWLRSGKKLRPIKSILGWISPRLQVKFDIVEKDLQICDPHGEPFANFVELATQKRRAEQARIMAEQARLIAEQQRQQEAQARRNAIPRLLAIGLTPEQIAETLSLSLEEINNYQ